MMVVRSHASVLFLTIVLGVIVCSVVVKASSIRLPLSGSRHRRSDIVLRKPNNYSSSSTLQNDPQRLRIDVECYNEGPPFALTVGMSRKRLNFAISDVTNVLKYRTSSSDPFVAFSQSHWSYCFSLQALNGQESGLDYGDAVQIVYAVILWKNRNREITCSSIGIHVVDMQRLRAVGTGTIRRVSRYAVSDAVK